MMPESAMCHSKILFACEPETAKEFVCELSQAHVGPHMHRGEDAGWSDFVTESEEWPRPSKVVTCRYKLIWEDIKEEIVYSQRASAPQVKKPKHYRGVKAFLGLLALISVFLTIVTANALTAVEDPGPCRHVDYAEVLDMAQDDVAKLYCEAGNRAEISKNLYLNASNINRILRGDRQWERWSDTYNRNWHSCTDLQATIRTALKKRGLQETPPCKGPNGEK